MGELADEVLAGGRCSGCMTMIENKGFPRLCAGCEAVAPFEPGTTSLAVFTCSHCAKAFMDERGLRQHTKAKHI